MPRSPEQAGGPEKARESIISCPPSPRCCLLRLVKSFSQQQEDSAGGWAQDSGSRRAPDTEGTTS